MTISNKILDEFLRSCKRPEDLLGDVGLARPRATDQHDIILLAEEFPAGKFAHQGLVDRRVIEGELLDLPGIGQLGGGDLPIKWRSKYGGMDASMMSQIKALEDENAMGAPRQRRPRIALND